VADQSRRDTATPQRGAVTVSARPPAAGGETLGERIGLEEVVARIRWVGVALGLVQTFLTVPPPISRAGCLAASGAMALTNVAGMLVRRLRAGAVEPVIALCLLLDFLVCTGWVMLLANDRYSTSYVMFSLVGIEAAVLYRWRGTFAFMVAFLLSIGALYWERGALLGFPVEAGSISFRATVILMVAAFAGAISGQSHRRQQAAGAAAARSQALYQVASNVARALDRGQALDAVSDALVAIAPRRWHAIALASADGESFELAHVRGEPSRVPLELPPPRVMRLREPLVVDDIWDDPRLLPGWSPPAELAAYSSGAALSVRSATRWYGLLLSLDPAQGGFDGADVDFLVALAAEAASVLERSELMARLADTASSDALTGLRNRREFERILDTTAPDRFALVAIDVDNLKPVNDEFGHEAGDAVLRAVATTLSALLREWDLVARVGGDEFAALLVGAGAEEALRVAERVRAAMHGVTVPHGSARVSIGCAAGEAGADMREVWRAADAALFRAKRSGRDRALGASRQDRRRDGTEWRAALPALLARRTLRAVYQPIVRFDDGGAVGFEALARPSGQHAEASVEALFAAAQRLGLSRDLDWLCRRTAIEGAHELPAGVPIFVNVGVGTLLDPVHDVDQMLLVLQCNGRTPRDVVLEITERETITDLDRLHHVLERYREAGFRIAVDDVGEGRCTLEVLATAMPEYLKLARSLVLDADSRGPRAAIEAAVAFARSSGATVIAEGVESGREVERMRVLGVHAGQGWHLGHPVEAGLLDGGRVLSLVRHTGA
jgi:diguanylate cyclase (GGDEF)-like protein